VGLIGNGEHYAKCASASTSQSPEEIRVTIGVRDKELALGGHERKLDDVVDTCEPLAF
jgi:hypothetical protein